MPPRILLLLPSNTYQAGAFLDAARRLGADVTVGSDHANVFGALQPDNLLALDFKDPAAVVAQAAAFAARHPVAAAFGVDDDTAVLAAHISRALGLRHGSVEACLAARDKHRQRVLMSEAGLRVPRFRLVGFGDDLPAASREAHYPCVLKPLRLSMSRGVMRADDPEQFLQSAGRLRHIVERSGGPADAFLVESFVPGTELALEGCMEAGRLMVLALFDKPDPLDGPFFAETIYVTPSRLAAGDQARLAQSVERAALAIGLERGPIHAEVRLNAEGAWLIELAARPIGGRCGAALRFEPGRRALEEILLGAALKGWESGSVGEWERETSAVAVYMIPVPRSGTLRSVTGVESARRVPHVDDVAITAHVGQVLEALPEGNRYLGFIFARADSPQSVVRAVREAHGKLAFELA